MIARHPRVNAAYGHAAGVARVGKPNRPQRRSPPADGRRDAAPPADETLRRWYDRGYIAFEPQVDAGFGIKSVRTSGTNPPAH